jgi:hypothetical protein
MGQERLQTVTGFPTKRNIKQLVSDILPKAGTDPEACV